jgi:anti-sigma factor RsiW
VQCVEHLRVQAYFDGEVDALAAADIERHAEHCPECSALLASLEETRSRIRSLPLAQAPAALRARLAQRLDAPATRAAPAAGSRRSGSGSGWGWGWGTRPFWLGALSGLGAALGAAAALFLIFFAPSEPLAGEVVAAHVRSLMPGHLTEVVSSDRHTVKPWFAGHADVSPLVADFAAQGYRLVGGRAEYFDRQRAAAVVYQHGAHVINVFSWVADRHAPSGLTTRDGYHLAFFRVGDLQYCAVSDTGWDELMGLVRLLQELGAHDARPEPAARE